jgi:hypothetical protein
MTELNNQITSCAELVALIDDRWTRWCHTVDQLSPEQLDRIGTCGHWSARDLLGHIATWDQFAIDRVQCILGDEPRPTLSMPIDLHNDGAVRRVDLGG